jgi:tetratricopeptide (TPR) repeat protein
MKRGNGLVAQEKYEAAIREYERLSPAAGELYARALSNIGLCHYELWQTDQAIDFYSKAIAASKNKYPRASYALGVALEDEGRLVGAREASDSETKKASSLV